MKMQNKYIIIVGDGMGDYPLEELGGKTPLDAASTPHIDRLLPIGRMGTVHTIPANMEPGSDVANMSLLGYDPSRYHTGRAPLEAASMGINLDPGEVAFRCNLVTLKPDAMGVTRMADYSAGHISSAESHGLIAALQQAARRGPLKLYPGVGYRHLLVWANGRVNVPTTPPHDISGESAGPHLRGCLEEPVLASFIEEANSILSGHAINRKREEEGKAPANAVWLWGQGKSPAMPTLEERYGLTGAMISAVDLLKGLGVYAGLEPVSVPGATGYLDTNYAGKVQAALTALKKGSLVYVHIEAPDEASHEGRLEQKIEAIEDIDGKVVAPLVEGAREFEKVRMLFVTDHFTPICKKTHVADQVPFLLVDGLNRSGTGRPVSDTFCERTARAAGWQVANGVELFRTFIGVSAGLK